MLRLLHFTQERLESLLSLQYRKGLLGLPREFDEAYFRLYGYLLRSVRSLPGSAFKQHEKELAIMFYETFCTNLSLERMGDHKSDFGQSECVVNEDCPCEFLQSLGFDGLNTILTRSFLPLRRHSPHDTSWFSITSHLIFRPSNCLTRSCSPRSVTDTITVQSSGWGAGPDGYFLFICFFDLLV